MAKSYENEGIKRSVNPDDAASKEKPIHIYRKRGVTPAPANHPWRQYRIAGKKLTTG